MNRKGRNKTDAFAALHQRLALLKSRDDITVLGILGVEPGWVQDWLDSHPGLIFTVEYTYSTGRPRKRTEQIGFRLLPPFQTTDSDVLLPTALMEFISAGVVTTCAEPFGTGFICKRCGGHAPTGIGYATSEPANRTVDSCPCGYSKRAA